MKLPYQQTIQDLFDTYSVTRNGLSKEQVEASFKKYGPNTLPEEEYESALTLFLRQFANPLIPVLIFAFVVTIFLHEYIDATVLFITVLLSVVLGFFQEYKAQEAVAALKKLTVPKAIVIREGKRQEVDSSELVPGDILLLEEGMSITCDARLIETASLSVNESVITGESLSVEKNTEVITNDVIINDQTNMVFAGSTVVRGNGMAIVVATGAATQIGQIATDISSIEKGQTPLQESLGRLSRLLVIAVLVIMAFLFVVGLLRGHGFYEMFLFAVSLAVSVLPEGLVIAVTIALAVGMSRMAKRKAVVRNMMAVETLGAVTVIATDKTGTLTENKLSVKKLFANGHDIVNDFEKDKISKLLLSCVLANDAVLAQEDQRDLGDPLDIALLNWARRVGENIDKIRSAYKRIAELPFSNDYRLMAVKVTKTSGGNNEGYIFVKGSPKAVINRCGFEMVEGKVVRLSDKVREDALNEVRRMASERLKPLAIAYKETSNAKEDLELEDIDNDLVLLGLVGFADPLRPEAIKAVKTVGEAGIRVLMLTGDHRLTASEIAKAVGIKDYQNILKGSDLDSMDDDTLREKLKVTNVFARVTPKHKLTIIRLLQETGEVVAMTGDGVNDAPALASADIGVAMGEGGTDVARGASDMVILDNNFATIEAAVEEGRGIFDNIKKVLLYLLATNVSEVALMVFALVFGFPLPLYPTQILWLNLVTDGLPYTALIFSPKEDDIMRRKPRDKNAFILDKWSMWQLVLLGTAMSITAIGVFLFFYTTHGLEYTRTATLIVMAFMQLINVFNIQAGRHSIFKSHIFENKAIWYAFGFSALLQLSVVLVPPLQELFRTVPLAVSDWILVFVISLSMIAFNELIYWVLSKRLGEN